MTGLLHRLAAMTRRLGLHGLLLPALLGLGLTAAPDVGAQGVSGSGTLKGTGTLAVQRCGRDRLHAQAQVVVAAGGTWSATTSEGAAFSGTSVPSGTSGRQLDLSFDAGSEVAFVASMASNAAELCHTSVVVTSAAKQKLLLSINRRGSRAKLVLRYTGTGVGGGRSGWARSGLTLKGPWTATP